MTKKAHSLPLLLTNKLFNKPQLITQTALQPIVDYVSGRTFGNISFLPNKSTKPQCENSCGPMEDICDENGMEEDNEDGWLDCCDEIIVDGCLTYKPIYGECGEGPVGTSYVGILEEAQELIASGTKTIIMSFSTPGGDASHCFSTALSLRQMCDDAGVSLISYIDEYALSAGVVFSIISDEIYIHPSASTGSIGCVVALQDRSKQMEMQGIKPVFITSTPGKVPFNQDGSFSESFLKDMQTEVDNLGDEFVMHVSKFTGMSADVIKGMDAKIYNANDAVKMGLADEVMDHNEFANYLKSKLGVNQNVNYDND